MKKFAFILFLFSLMACNENRGNLTVSTGRYGEIYVIVDEDLLTNRLKTALNQVLAKPQMLYGGEEPYFKLLFMTPNQAKGSLIYEGTVVAITRSGEHSGMRTLLPPEKDSVVVANRRAGIQSYIQKNVWSMPQQVLYLFGDNADSLANYLLQNEKGILATVLKMERSEAVGRMTRINDGKITKEILEKHGIEVKAPIAYHIASNSKINEKEGFIWLRNDGSEVDLNVIIHYQPYTDTTQFQLENLIARRDSVVKPYITGELQGSYMATDTQFPYFIETVEFNGHFAREYNALWTLENDFMGGPYYSVTVHDEINQRLISLEGFVFAPNKDKTRYLRELQGILFGVKF